MGEKNLIISIHDFAPNHEKQLREIVNMLYDVGINKMNLLLVPDWEPDSKPGENDYRKHPRFVDWIKELTASGYELVQHGCHHKSPKRKGYYRGPIEYIMGEFVAVGLAEFQNLTYNEAMQRIKYAQDIFSDIGLEVKGFVPPWWQLSSGAERAVRDSGYFDYYIVTNAWDLFGRFSTVPILNLKSGKKHMSRELCFEPRDELANNFTKLLARTVTDCEQARTVRFGIHPPDVCNKDVREYIIKHINKTKPGREVKTYSELLYKQ